MVQISHQLDGREHNVKAVIATAASEANRRQELGVRIAMFEQIDERVGRAIAFAKSPADGIDHGNSQRFVGMNAEQLQRTIHGIGQRPTCIPNARFDQFRQVQFQATFEIASQYFVVPRILLVHPVAVGQVVEHVLAGLIVATDALDRLRDFGAPLLPFQQWQQPVDGGGLAKRSDHGKHHGRLQRLLFVVLQGIEHRVGTASVTQVSKRIDDLQLLWHFPAQRQLLDQHFKRALVLLSRQLARDLALHGWIPAGISGH